MRYLRGTTAGILIWVAAAAAQEVDLWTFDRLDRIGGHPTRILGNPQVVDTPVGKAVEFDGVDDALFVDVHPLAGAETFTWEAIFRPDGGNIEQRWFHLQESGTENRMLFEIRVVDGQWYLDSYVHSSTAQKALIDPSKRHALGVWYHVASVYDGREFRNYVNGVEQSAAAIHFAPQGRGRASIGVRINVVNHFKGAIYVARFTRRALAPAEFLRVPSVKVKSSMVGRWAAEQLRGRVGVSGLIFLPAYVNWMTGFDASGRPLAVAGSNSSPEGISAGNTLYAFSLPE